MDTLATVLDQHLAAGDALARGGESAQPQSHSCHGTLDSTPRTMPLCLPTATSTKAGSGCPAQLVPLEQLQGWQHTPLASIRKEGGPLHAVQPNGSPSGSPSGKNLRHRSMEWGT